MKSLVRKLVNGVMTLADKWLGRRADDNIITYAVRVFMGLVIALYVFYHFNTKYLNKYLFNVQHSLTYVMELDK